MDLTPNLVFKYYMLLNCSYPEDANSHPAPAVECKRCVRQIIILAFSFSFNFSPFIQENIFRHCRTCLQTTVELRKLESADSCAMDVT